MKKLFMLAIAASISSSALLNAEAFSKENIYVGGGVGVFTAQSFKEIDNHPYLKGKPKGKPPVLYNLFLGYKFNQYLRADINGQYRELNYTSSKNSGGVTESSKQKIKNLSVFLNGYVDAPNNTIFVPYLTAGIGCSRNNPGDLKSRVISLPAFDVDAKGKNTNSFAWTVGFGTRIKIYKNIDADLSYRYADLGKVKIRSSTDASGQSYGAASQKLNLHQGILSLIYHV
jgi:opacity protein-like surface antigen